MAAARYLRPVPPFPLLPLPFPLNCMDPIDPEKVRDIVSELADGSDPVIAVQFSTVLPK